MKKLLASALFALLMTACGSVATILTYDVTFTTDNPDRMSALSLATRHVVERRLARLEGALLDYDVEYDKEAQVATIEIEVDNAKSAEILNEEMTAPFTFEVRYKVEEHQEGDIEVEGVGSFRDTGIYKSDIDWVIGQTTEPPLNRGRVLIGFTDESVPGVKEIFEEQAGNTIGLFVRDRLTAAVEIGEEFEKVLVIDGLPSGEIAKVFADDMNVGIHMTFTQK
jgi:hypothetical protein|tara:strand:- start:37826 stop:38497 length:672 start_codon:yes stop_codon:yes gene_type:complete